MTCILQMTSRKPSASRSHLHFYSSLFLPCSVPLLLSFSLLLYLLPLEFEKKRKWLRYPHDWVSGLLLAFPAYVWSYLLLFILWNQRIIFPGKNWLNLSSRNQCYGTGRSVLSWKGCFYFGRWLMSIILVPWFRCYLLQLRGKWSYPKNWEGEQSRL